GRSESMKSVGGEARSGPVSTVEVAPGRRQALPSWKEPPGQEPAPGPALGRQTEPHRRGGGVGPPLRPALDEVPPDGGEEQTLHQGVEAASEGDGLAAMMGQGVA